MLGGEGGCSSPGSTSRDLSPIVVIFVLPLCSPWNFGHMARTPLPRELGHTFAVGEAREAGLTPGRLRAHDLLRPFHGVRSVLVLDPRTRDRFGAPLGELERDHLHRASAYAARMGRHEFFSHVTAAVMWGLPLPLSLVAGPVHAAVVSPYRLPRAQGVRGHQTRAQSVRVTTDAHTGLRVATPATTWAMLGAVIGDVRDLVAAGDATVREWRVDAPLTSIDQLSAAAEAHRRVGIRKLREALPLLRTGSASRPESRVRLELVWAGLPEPELNFDVTWDDQVIACVDLAYPALKVAMEYEGEHHLVDPVQWARDIARYERLAAAGWTVVRITKSEVFAEPHVLVTRVRRAIAGRG